MRESIIEKQLVEEVKKRKGIAFKFVSPGFNGVPDRIVLLPYGHIGFVELKAPGEKMRKLQIQVKEKIERLGFSVYCVDNKEMIGGILDAIQTT